MTANRGVRGSGAKGKNQKEGEGRGEGERNEKWNTDEAWKLCANEVHKSIIWSGEILRNFLCSLSSRRGYFTPPGYQA